MADEKRTLEVDIALGVDSQKIKDSGRSVDTLRKSISDSEQAAEKARQGFRRMAEEAMKMREVGATLAGVGAAITGPLIAAAQVYAQKYGQFEATSRNYIKAQNDSVAATERLGRVAASVLTPSLNEAASIMQKVADFAEKNPQFVEGAVNFGTALATAGATLMVVGQATATMNKLQEVVMGGGLTGTISKSIIGIGAFAIGLEAGEKAVNAFGSATGDARLESFKLSDAMKTVREIIVMAIGGLANAFIEATKSASQLGAVFQGAWAQFTTSLDKTTDQLATTFRVLMLQLSQALGDFQNGVIHGIAEFLKNAGFTDQAAAIDKGRNSDAIVGSQFVGKSNYQVRQEQELQDYNKRQADRDKSLNDLGAKLVQDDSKTQNAVSMMYDNLSKFVDGATAKGGFVDSGSLGGFGKTISDFFGKIFNSGGGSSANGSGVGGSQSSPEGLQAFISYQKSIKQSDKSYDLEKTQAARAYQQNELKATRDHAAAIQQEKQNQARQEFDLARKFQEDRQKSQVDFNRSEAEIEKKANFERLKRFKDHNLTLDQLAQAGDVAGFINEQKNFKNSEDDQSKQEELDRKDRLNSYEQQNRDAKLQYDRELRDMRENNSYKLQDMETQYNREKADRATAYQEQVNQLALKHQQERQQLDQNFAEQLASLTGNLGNLSNLRNQYYAQEQVAFDAFLKNQKGDLGKLRQIYADQLGVNPALSPVASSTGSSGGSSHYRAYGGSVMRNQPYIVGERKPELFIPKFDGMIAPLGSHSGGSGLNINGGIHIGAGNNVTVQDVESALSRFADQLNQAHSNAGRVLS